VDTRTKIVAWEQGVAILEAMAGENGEGIVVTGHFDPLLASHAARLRELGQRARPLVVVITDPARPLLPPRARAELVAALAAVDRVILAPAAGFAPPVGFPGSRLVRDEELDRERTAALIRHVRERQRAANQDG
jgi:hypothetical protein